MWNIETARKAIASLPPLYATEDVPAKDKIVGAHFFLGSADWWIVEADPAEGVMFGYACLGNPQDAEWGYVSFDELAALRVRSCFEVDFDLHWKPRPAAEVSGINC